MQYSGDYSKTFYVPSSGIAPGLLAGRYINPSLDIMLEASFIKMQADDHGKRDRSNNLHFDATMLSANLLLKYKFDNGYILDTLAKWAPYVIAGAGVLNSNSEGFGFGKNVAPPFTADVTALNLCAGIGVTYKMSPKISLFLQTCAWFPFSDEIDGWSVDYEPNQRNDSFLKTSVGIIFIPGKNP
jgi:hypothetical protein